MTLAGSISYAQSSYPIEITTVSFLNSIGQPISPPFHSDQFILVSPTLRNTTSQDVPFLCLVQITDSQNLSFFLGFCSGQLTANTSNQFGLGVSLQGFQAGNYYLKVLVWNHWIWPSNSDFSILSFPFFQTFQVIR
ncbi:MAG: hypothetical protein QMD88_08755 [Coprothermobacterota bacterium]|nr:hypothetical protein [Coprothermobacterota bacterium]